MRVRNHIQAILETAKRPAVLCSFGKESVLLLHEVCKFCNPAVIWLKGDLTPAQKEFPYQMIRDWNLTVFSLTPSMRYPVPAPTGEWSIVSEHEFSGSPIPIVRDLIHDEKRCLLKIDLDRSPGVPWPFDVIFTGWKDADRHPLLGGVIPYPPDGVEIGGARWYAPLRDLTDVDVWAAIYELGLPFNKAKYEGNDRADPDCVIACSKCLTEKGRIWCHDVGREIEATKWDSEGARAVFLQKFFPEVDRWKV